MKNYSGETEKHRSELENHKNLLNQDIVSYILHSDDPNYLGCGQMLVHFKKNDEYRRISLAEAKILDEVRLAIYARHHHLLENPNWNWANAKGQETSI